MSPGWRRQAARSLLRLANKRDRWVSQDFSSCHFAINAFFLSFSSLHAIAWREENIHRQSRQGDWRRSAFILSTERFSSAYPRACLISGRFLEHHQILFRCFGERQTTPPPLMSLESDGKDELFRLAKFQQVSLSRQQVIGRKFSRRGDRRDSLYSCFAPRRRFSVFLPFLLLLVKNPLAQP